jgi:hypothetical protein
MARVKGIKEKLHMPLYDAFFVKKDQTFREAMEERDPRIIRFFVDVQNKTRLETNLQAAGVLPSMNSFEARAMRVIVSSPKIVKPPEKGDEERVPEELFGPEINFLADLIYWSVTTLLVGEKIHIEMPTFWFPAGAGVSPGIGAGIFAYYMAQNHGNPDPLATFRFAEPVSIESQQNFRVEMMFPQGVPEDTVAPVQGPLRIWTVLDGYLTRDVQ